LILALLPFFGAERLHFSEIIQSGSIAQRIFFQLRLPRLVLTLMAGGTLAILGGTYQILFHNPLAEPYILGVSSAVTLGAAGAEILFGMPAYSYVGTGLGAVAALAVTGLMIWLFTQRSGEALDRIVLFGMGINFVLSSLLFLLPSYTNRHLGGGSMRWLFGQIPWMGSAEAFWFAAACLPFGISVLAYARHLDALSLGDSVARTLGYSPERTRVLLLLITSAYLSLIVSVTGAIGFVGLVVPHAARLLFRPGSTRRLLAVAFLLGALFLGIADVLSRTLLPPFEFPIGILTTLFGGPLFLWLLWRSR
jgi:iron complex transport system permease protein